VIDRHRVPHAVPLAAGAAEAADRRIVDEAAGSSRLARWLHALMNAGERWNADDEGVHAPTVNLCVKARKPMPVQPEAR